MATPATVVGSSYGFPHVRKPSAIPEVLLEWFQDLRAEGFAKNTCVCYAADLKDLAGFLTVSLEDATTADLRAYRRSLVRLERLLSQFAEHSSLDVKGMTFWARCNANAVERASVLAKDQLFRRDFEPDTETRTG